MALKTPYVTVAEADVTNAANAAWLALTTAQKDAALLEARYYLDAHFTCPGVDEDNPPDELKTANAWLGADSGSGTGLYKTTNLASNVKSESVSAGPVSTSKTVIAPDRWQPSHHAQVLAVLHGHCTFNGTTVNLVRA